MTRGFLREYEHVLKIARNRECMSCGWQKSRCGCPYTMEEYMCLRLEIREVADSKRHRPTAEERRAQFKVVS